MRIAGLVHPVLPTDAPFWLDRTSTAIAIGIAVAAAVLAVRSGALVLRLPELDFADEPEARQDADHGAVGAKTDVFEATAARSSWPLDPFPRKFTRSPTGCPQAFLRTLRRAPCPCPCIPVCGVRR